MGKKSSRVEEAQIRAKQIAAQEEEKRRKNKLIRVSIAVGLLLIVIVLVIVIIVQSIGNSNNTGAGNASNASTAVSESDYAKGGAIYLYKGNISAQNPDPSKPVIAEYYDYACPACLFSEHEFDGALETGSNKGDYIYQLHTVPTASAHGNYWGYVAADASLRVAVGAPEKWEAYHNALMKFGYDELIVKQNTAFIADEKASADYARQLATSLGIDANLLSDISIEKGKEYLDKATEIWREDMKKAGITRLETPMYLVNGKRIESDANAKTAKEAYQSLLSNITKALGSE